MSTTQTPPATDTPPQDPPAPQPPLPSIRTTEPPEGGWAEGFPKVFFSVYERVPPRVIKTQEEQDALDMRFWMTIPPQDPPADAPPEKWPKVFYNVNVPPKILGTQEDVDALGPDWRELALPEQKEATS